MFFRRVKLLARSKLNYLPSNKKARMARAAKAAGENSFFTLRLALFVVFGKSCCKSVRINGCDSYLAFGTFGFNGQG